MPWLFAFPRCCHDGNDKETEASGSAPCTFTSESALLERPLFTEGYFDEQGNGATHQAAILEKASTSSTLNHELFKEIEQIHSSTVPQPQAATATDALNPVVELFEQAEPESTDVVTEEQVKPEEQSETAPPLVLLFNDDGKPKSVTVPTKPLGMSYHGVSSGTESCSVKQVSPGSLAEKLGIQQGWKFVAIGGQPVANLPFEEVKKFLEKEVATLPDAAAQCLENETNVYEAPTQPLLSGSQPGKNSSSQKKRLVFPGLCFKGKNPSPGSRVGSPAMEQETSASTTASEGSSPEQLSKENTATEEKLEIAGKETAEAESATEQAGKAEDNAVRKDVETDAKCSEPVEQTVKAEDENAGKTDAQAEMKGTEPVEQAAEIDKPAEEAKVGSVPE